MKQEVFIQKRKESWDRFEASLENDKLKKNASWFPKAFRELTQDLNITKSQAFNPALIERLNRLVLEGNQRLYGQHNWSIRNFLDFVVLDFPRTVRKRWKGILASQLLFYGLSTFFAILVTQQASSIYEIIPTVQIEQIEEMYNPDSPHYLTPREVSSDADMFGFYIYNNISIAFRTFAGGILAGIGSLLLLAYNAVFLGSVAGHVINKGYTDTFFPFIIGHSSFELSAIILSGYAGLCLGFSFFIPGNIRRSTAVGRTAKQIIPLISGTALMLLIAAAIEAFWSSRHELGELVRLSVGIGLWVLLILYILLSGRKARHV